MTPEDVSARLRNVFNNIALIPAAEQGGALIRAIIDDRTRNGEFLGGPFALKGYSEAPMPFSEVTRQISAGDEDVFWATIGGKPQKYLIGGYRRFRELTGRRVDKVELSFSGAMLNSLFPRVDPTSEGVDIIVTVPASQMEKAFHTHQQRRWLALSREESDRVFESIGREIRKLLP